MAGYKLEHELFMTGHQGTTYVDVALVTSTSCIACLVRDLCLLSTFSKIIRPRILLDFTLLVFPNILSVTLLNNHISIFLWIILLACILYCVYFLQSRKAMRKICLALDEVNLDVRKKFITYFRSIVNLCTAVAILAVDFPVFPRRLAKAETFGFGGMDIGVGLFVIANAIVSNEARGKYTKLHATAQLGKSFISTLPLLILGFARLLAVKGSDYQEHVTEYGVHWNFFFTLAALKISLTMVYSIIDADRSALFAFMAIAVHQILLSTGLSLYIINGLDGTGERAGLIDANREGIYSLTGYIALYMLGVQMGSVIFRHRHSLREWLEFAKHLAWAFAASTLIMAILHATVEPVSRRLANAAFVFWILSLSCLMILQCLLVDIIITCFKTVSEDTKICHGNNRLDVSDSSSEQMTTVFRRKTVQPSKDKTSTASEEDLKESKDSSSSSSQEVCLMEAISYNSLLYFLLANVMTGVVNMSVATIYTDDLYAVAILIMYMFILCAVIVILRAKNISTKIW